MFKISPIQDENTKNKYAEMCGTVSIPQYFAYQMINQDDNSLMAFSQFDIGKDDALISDLKEAAGLEDFEAMFILGRQTMNFIDLCGVHACRATKNTASEKLLLSLGFKKTDSGDYFCDMTDMFSGNCSGEAVKLDT